ncbi:MAG: VanZ family protein [Chloroflexota bacterium]
MQKIDSSRYLLLLFIGGMVLILYTTLFPFDFVIDNALSLEQWTLSGSSRYDLFRNVLLFIPLGVGLAGLLSQWLSTTIGRIFATVLLCAILSAVIEFLQCSLTVRTSSVLDMLMNIAGAFLGAVTFHALRKWPFNDTQSLLNRSIATVSKTISRISLHLLLCAIPFFTWSLSEQIQDTSLASWDDTFTLLIGNERSGNRSWDGIVNELHFINRAIEQNEAKKIFSRTLMPEAFGSSLIASYRLTDGNSFHDRAENLSKLVWRPNSLTGPGNDSISINADQWLETEEAVSALTKEVSASSAFTAWAVIQSGNRRQTGPARIISISENSQLRNFTMGQQEQDLVLRLRTRSTGENGTYPELRIANVFSDLAPHHLLISYDGSVLQAFVDSVDNLYTFHITPSITFFQFFLPVDYWTIRIDSYSIQVFRTIYYSLILIPLGILLWYLARYIFARYTNSHVILSKRKFGNYAVGRR